MSIRILKSFSKDSEQGTRAGTRGSLSNASDINKINDNEIVTNQEIKNQYESKTLFELLNDEFQSETIYSTGIDFIDDTLEGGFAMGQLVTITGEQEAGKTQLLNQILSNVANGFKCLYFSLEFNKRQIVKYFKNKLQNKTVSEKALKNIYIITNDMIDSEITKIIETIEYFIKELGVKFIAIDSTLAIYNKDYTGEQEVTEIFRQLQKVTLENDVLLLVISQSSKQDNKENRISIFGSQKANHYTNIMIHIKYNKDETRELIFAKNKQTGIHSKIKLEFDRENLLFIPVKEEKTSSPKSNSKNDDDNKKKTITELLF